jgi:hypothetical protein
VQDQAAKWIAFRRHLEPHRPDGTVSAKGESHEGFLRDIGNDLTGILEVSDRLKADGGKLTLDAVIEAYIALGKVRRIHRLVPRAVLDHRPDLGHDGLRDRLEDIRRKRIAEPAVVVLVFVCWHLPLV